jgi:hypothetical protein
MNSLDIKSRPRTGFDSTFHQVALFPRNLRKKHTIWQQHLQWEREPTGGRMAVGFLWGSSRHAA